MLVVADHSTWFYNPKSTMKKMKHFFWREFDKLDTLQAHDVLLAQNLLTIQHNCMGYNLFLTQNSIKTMVEWWS